MRFHNKNPSPRRRFDWILDPSSVRPGNEWDIELRTSRNFSVVPSLGSLVPGWILVVPRRPMLNLAQLSVDEKHELASLIDELRDAMTPFRGNVFQFEHGSRHVGSKTGCGIDQAHLHLVPLQFDLIEAVRSTPNSPVDWSEANYCADPWAVISPTQEYALIRDPTNTTIVGTMRRSESQWIRKVIASRIRRPMDWNYTEYPGLENIRETVRIVQR